MRMALSFARRGTGKVSPNPRVGCVIVDYSSDGGRVVSFGYHRQYGGPHAEADALGKCASVRGCTAYVNLEPCCHTGHTPPCCDALIRSGISRVVIGISDPDPRVSGGGAARLADAGVKVVSGVLEDECRQLNRGFVKRVTSGYPWVTAKAAISLDGDIALANGDSKWITGAPARRRAHMMRAENDAVMTGAGTILKDDPELSVRDSDGRSPLKVIVDRDLEIPCEARALDGGDCLVFTAATADEEKISRFRERRVKVKKMELDEERHIPPRDILRELGAMGLNYLMIEGGAGLVGSFLECGAADELSVFIAPKLMGNGLNLSRNISFASMSDAISVKDSSVRKIGADVWFRGKISCSPAS
jgi:diaminohydroxyphosphoribosylaminopyrimidine deaminase/5-amino-6-(5-phosphoribosylamino)uracil reductase